MARTCLWMIRGEFAERAILTLVSDPPQQPKTRDQIFFRRNIEIPKNAGN